MAFYDVCINSQQFNSYLVLFWKVNIVLQLSAKMSSNKVTRPLKKEQVASGFQELRQQQRVIASRLAEIESDLREHE